jgi:rRNA maturation endonuclease Nob1
MVWLPLMIYGLSTQRLALAMTLGLSGFLFALLARAVVWSRRCPECGEHFGASSSTFDEIWEASGCRACGVSLFQLRRREPLRESARGLARAPRHPRTA